MPPEPTHQQNDRRTADYVPWTIWVWSIGITSTLMLGLFGLYFSLSSRLEESDAARQTIQVQLSQIQADIKNLDGRLAEIRSDIKSLK